MPEQFQSESESLHLAVEVTERHPDRLSLRYAVANIGNRPVFLLNTPVASFSAVDRAKLNLQECIIEIFPDRASIAQKMAVVPEGMSVEQRVFPAVVLLKPGQKMERRLNLPLPLVAESPYIESVAARDGLVVERPLYFEVGYFVGTAESERLATKIATDHGEFLYFEPVPDTAQKILRAGPLGHPVPARIAKTR